MHPHIIKLVQRALKYVIPSLVQGGLGYRPKARLNAHSPFNLTDICFIFKILKNGRFLVFKKYRLFQLTFR
jgi:hypothetical protein